MDYNDGNYTGLFNVDETNNNVNGLNNVITTIGNYFNNLGNFLLSNGQNVSYIGIGQVQNLQGTLNTLQSSIGTLLNYFSSSKNFLLCDGTNTKYITNDNIQTGAIDTSKILSLDTNLILLKNIQGIFNVGTPDNFVLCSGQGRPYIRDLDIQTNTINFNKLTSYIGNGQIDKSTITLDKLNIGYYDTSKSQVITQQRGSYIWYDMNGFCYIGGCVQTGLDGIFKINCTDKQNFNYYIENSYNQTNDNNVNFYININGYSYGNKQYQLNIRNYNNYVYLYEYLNGSILRQSSNELWINYNGNNYNGSKFTTIQCDRLKCQGFENEGIGYMNFKRVNGYVPQSGQVLYIYDSGGYYDRIGFYWINDINVDNNSCIFHKNSTKFKTFDASTQGNTQFGTFNFNLMGNPRALCFGPDGENATIAGNGDIITIIGATDFGNNAVCVFYDEDGGQMNGAPGTTINPSGGIGTTGSIKYKNNVRKKEIKYNDYYNRLINDFNIYTFTYKHYEEILKNLTYDKFKENFKNKNIDDDEIKKMYDKKINRLKHKQNNYHYGVIFEEMKEKYKNITCSKKFIENFKCPTNDEKNCEYCNGKQDEPYINITNINYYVILALKDMNESIIKPMTNKINQLENEINEIKQKFNNKKTNKKK